MDFEQRGARRAEYGVSLLQRVAKDLSAGFGRGFGYSNLNLFRQFYLTYRDRRPILQSVTGESLTPLTTPVNRSPHQEFMLSWRHYVRLLPLKEQAKRDFDEEEARRAGWSVRQLHRQINSMLYERVALSKKKGELLKRAEKTENQYQPKRQSRTHIMLNFRLPEPSSKKNLKAPSSNIWLTSSSTRLRGYICCPPKKASDRK